MSVKIGTVIHYYDKIGVAIVALTDSLSVGDKIKFTRGGEELFSQNVESIQLEHKSIDKAESGQEVGLKTEQKVKEGAEVFKE